MTIKINTATYNGVDGVKVDVEIDISNGLPSFNIVGLPDTAVKESKERVRAAIKNCGYDFPVKRITINLAPADIRKDGTHYDLPIALGILIASEQIAMPDIDKIIIAGELSLNGDLKRIRGALPILIIGKEKGYKKFFIPKGNHWEGRFLEDIQVIPFNSLKQVIDYIYYPKYNCPLDNLDKSMDEEDIVMDFNEVIGQDSTKRALEVASAGGHNVVLTGSPGCGKTMLAKCVPSILPDLTREEELEVMKIYSASGMIKEDLPLRIYRPFRSPHHTTTKIAMVGGGINLTPGEITLAHRGVLYLDEILEFNRGVLECLRQPLEDRNIRITRVNGTVEYPANFMLIASMNPCLCGNYLSENRRCSCNPTEIKRYLSRLSGPLLDRMDIFSFVKGINYNEIKEYRIGESSTIIKQRVSNAREMQRERFKSYNIYCNAEMNSSAVRKFCILDKQCKNFFESNFDKLALSTRSYTRILKVARTIADLEGGYNITLSNVIEALQYRKFLEEKVI